MPPWPSTKLLLIDTGFAFGFALIFALIAFFAFQSNSRNKKDWKPLVGGLAAGLVLSGLAGAINTGEEVFPGAKACAELEGASLNEWFFGEDFESKKTITLEDDYNVRAHAEIVPQISPDASTAMMILLSGLEGRHRQALLSESFMYLRLNDMTQPRAMANFTTWQYSRAYKKQQDFFSRVTLIGAAAELASQPARAASQAFSHIWASATAPQDAWVREQLSPGQNVSISFGAIPGGDCVDPSPPSTITVTTTLPPRAQVEARFLAELGNLEGYTLNAPDEVAYALKWAMATCTAVDAFESATDFIESERSEDVIGTRQYIVVAVMLSDVCLYERQNAFFDEVEQTLDF